ncbi:histidine phosphatase family protein [Margalitia sp. FSL K6-0131]|uniref:histidine phosphatase family protein n=1 Tax=Margalitia sp. FSL K6-0131 TaxID=2954604 RepID=UPI0030FA8E1C
MIILYITRHGETEWNTQNRMQGWKDSNLTENGIKNAIELGERLKDISFSAIYSSPSGRTVTTTKMICGDRNISIIYEDNLKEIFLGEWEGKTKENIKENYPNDYNAFWNCPHLYTPAQGESIADVKERVLKVLERIQKEHSSGNILIVTHSIVIKCLFLIFKGLSNERLWDPPFIHDTSLTVVELDKENIRMVLEGDISHRGAIATN